MAEGFVSDAVREKQQLRTVVREDYFKGELRWSSSGWWPTPRCGPGDGVAD